MAFPIGAALQGAAGVGQLIGGLFGRRNARRAQADADRARNAFRDQLRKTAQSQLAQAAGVRARPQNTQERNRELGDIQDSVARTMGTLRGTTASPGAYAANVANANLNAAKARGGAFSRYLDRQNRQVDQANSMQMQGMNLMERPFEVDSVAAQRRADQMGQEANMGLSSGLGNIAGAANAFDTNSAFAEGGIIPGEETAYDSVEIKARPGEIVMSQEDQKYIMSAKGFKEKARRFEEVIKKYKRDAKREEKAQEELQELANGGEVQDGPGLLERAASYIPGTKQYRTRVAMDELEKQAGKLETALHSAASQSRARAGAAELALAQAMSERGAGKMASAIRSDTQDKRKQADALRRMIAIREQQIADLNSTYNAVSPVLNEAKSIIGFLEGKPLVADQRKKPSAKSAR